MGVLRGTLFIVGTSIGAGFLSGAELVRFFHTERFFLPVLFSCTVYFFAVLLFLWLGKRHGGYRGTVNALFGRAAPVVYSAVFCCSFIVCAGMIAGLDALLPRVKPLLSVVGLIVVVFCIGRGLKGISALNLVLVPALLLFIFFYSRGEKSFSYPILPDGAGGFLGGTLYAAMNAFLAAPVLMDAGREMKRTLPPALLSAIAIAASAVCILGRIYREGAGAIGAEMPFLYVMRGKIFYAAAALAILTSLASSLYPMLLACEGIGGGKKYAAKAVVLLAAFALSRVGLTGIVRFFYPAVGFAGIPFSALCALNEYLFQKYHKEVHSRGKQAKNAGRAHHEVEFEHLPAIHDEIAKPCAGDDILSHDRSDPRHADVHFQHGDERGKRGGDHKFP